MAAGNLGPGIISLLVPGVGNFRAENVEFVPQCSSRNAFGVPTAMDKLASVGYYIVRDRERGEFYVPLTLGILVKGK